jgi:hypothetical protein
LHVPQGAVFKCWKQPSRALWIAENMSVAMEKYLFLDFDGVLNTARYAKPMQNRLEWKQALMVVE